MNRLLSAHLALFATNLIYGVNYTVAKDVMPRYIQPSGFIFCRVTGALILFWIIHALFYREKVSRGDMKRFILCGLCGVAFNQLLFFQGLNITTSINAAIIMTVNPVLVLIMAAVIIRERVTLMKISGILLGLAGALTILLFGDNFSFGSETLAGDLMIFFNAIFYGIYLVLVKPLMIRYKPITVIKWVFLFGYIAVIPFGWQEFTEIHWRSMPSSIFMETAFVIIGTTFFAYLLNIFALKEVSPSTASIYIYLQPVLAVIVAILAGRDALSTIKILAAFAIFLGVYLVSKPQKVEDSP